MREAKKHSLGVRENNADSEQHVEKKAETLSLFSLTQILLVTSIVLSRVALCYKRREVMALVNKPKPQPQPTQPQIPVGVKPVD